MIRRLHRLAAALALLALLAGCGAGQLRRATGLDAADQLLNQQFVGKVAAGPERALYQWWLYVQYNDQADYLKMLAPGLRSREMRANAIESELPAASRALDVAVPNVLSITRTGPSATIYTTIVYHQLVGSSRFITVQAPQAFSLVQVAGQWYIADDHFIAQQAAH